MDSISQSEIDIGDVLQQYEPSFRGVDFCLSAEADEQSFSDAKDFSERFEKRFFNLFFKQLREVLGQFVGAVMSDGKYSFDGVSQELKKMAEKVIQEGFIKTIRYRHLLNDEPKIFLVGSEYGDFLRKNSDSRGPSSSTANASSFWSRDDAFIKFLGETFERTSCSFYKKKDLIFSSFRDLTERGLNAVNPEDFSGFSKKQFEAENLLAKTRVSVNSVLSWTRGKSLVSGKKIYVPAQTVYAPYRYENNEAIIRLPITTGAAAHTDKNEAVYRGICEVIERDAFIIFWLNKLSPPIVDLESSYGDYLKPFLKSFKRYNLEIFVLDITTDIPVPSFLTLIIDKTGLGPVISMGNKTDFDIKKAITGSIEEALKVRYFGRHQLLMNRALISQSAKNYRSIKTTTERCLFWSRPEMFKEIEFLLRGDKKIIKEDSVGISSRKKVLKVLEYFKKNNLEVIAVETTFDKIRECDFRAFMIIIPEFQPLYLWEEYKCLGGKRLYEVPVRLNYLKNPNKEENLNKVPHPFL